MAEIPRWQWLGRVMLDGRLHASAKIVAYWISRYAHSETHEFFAGLESMQKLTGLPLRTVQHGRQQLVKTGWLKLEKWRRGSAAGSCFILTVSAQSIAPNHVGIHVAEDMFKLVPPENAQSIAPNEGPESDVPRNGLRAPRNRLRARRNALRANDAKAQCIATDKVDSNNQENSGHHHRERGGARDDGGRDAVALDLAETFVRLRARYWAETQPIDASDLVDAASQVIAIADGNVEFVTQHLDWAMQKHRHKGNRAPSSPLFIRDSVHNEMIQTRPIRHG